MNTAPQPPASQIMIFVPGAPILIPGVGGATDPAVGLRRRCVEVIDDVLAGGTAQPAVITDVVVIAAADPGGDTNRLDAGSLRDPRPDPQRGYDIGRLTARRRSARPAGSAASLGIGVGQALLSEAGCSVPVRSVPLTSGVVPPELSDAPHPGERSAEHSSRLWMIIGDGSAVRRAGGPTVPDPRAQSFDADLLTAIEAADPAALRALPADLAEQLLVTGLPAWRAASRVVPPDRPITSTIHYADDPFGVFMVLATWRW